MIILDAAGEVRRWRGSRVDAVVINRDPTVGDLTIVQAKKYSGVIGVSQIRELVGAIEDKRAGGGMLVNSRLNRTDLGFSGVRPSVSPEDGADDLATRTMMLVPWLE